jgi:hypothetical protein
MNEIIFGFSLLIYGIEYFPGFRYLFIIRMKLMLSLRTVIMNTKAHESEQLLFYL